MITINIKTTINSINIIIFKSFYLIVAESLINIYILVKEFRMTFDTI